MINFRPLSLWERFKKKWFFYQMENPHHDTYYINVMPLHSDKDKRERFLKELAGK